MLSILQPIITAALLGAFIGLQREKESQDKKFIRFAGLRSSMLVAMLGATAASLGQINEFILPITLAVFGLLIVVVYANNAFTRNKIGGTSELSLLMLFLVGVLCANNQATIAIIITIILGLIHSLRNTLHKLTTAFSENEILDTLKFATIIFVILPFLPNKTIDPLGIFNPYTTWLMVVLISGISYLGYIIAKFIGAKKGIGVTALIGGLISSTATTTTMAAANKRNPLVVWPFAFAILIASATMLARVLVEVAIINPDLLKTLSIPLGIMILTSLLLAWHFWPSPSGTAKKAASQVADVKDMGFKSPFTIAPAIKFALLLIAILGLIKLTQHLWGSTGVLLSAFLAGLTDVDAITLSLSSLSAKSAIPETLATQGITIAILVNTAVKSIYVYLFAGLRLAKTMLIAMSIIIASGMITLLLM